MLNSEDFGNRIQKLMDYYGLSASAFADSLAVGRSSISHILSGRNKPSLDFVLKIIEAYPEIELHWLLSGKGTFPKSEDLVRAAENIPQPLPPVSTTDTKTVQDLFSNAIPESKTPNTDIPPKNSIQHAISIGKEIDRIVIFYSDGTFTSYQKEKS